MATNMKYILLILVIMTALLSGGEVFANDIPENYTPLEPIPGTTVGECDPANPDANCDVNISSFIPNAIKVVIQIAGALAVIMIVVGGFQYLSTDAIGDKEEGKGKIKNALTGLLLAIAAFVVLQTINPGTLSLNLQLQPINPLEFDSAATSTPVDLGGYRGQSWPAAWGSPLQPDAEIRDMLRRAAIPITVNQSTNCTTVGQSSCTSLDGLSQRAINGLVTLSAACFTNFGCGGRTGVQIVITGGTEYWLHGNTSPDPNLNNTLHKPGGGGVDLRKNAAIDALIMGPGGSNRTTNKRGCNAPGTAYLFQGTVYIDETGGDPHWHVCY